VPEPSAYEVEGAIEMLKRHNSPGIDQIPAELIKARGRTINPEIHKLINSVWNKEELPEQWQESIVACINKKGDKTEAYHFCQIYTKFYPIFCCLSKCHMQRLGIIVWILM
jgi:uncharacterized protein with ParB-like and HNH nuclease domain